MSEHLTCWLWNALLDLQSASVTVLLCHIANLFIHEPNKIKNEYDEYSLSCRRLSQTLITVLFVSKATSPMMLSGYCLAGKLKVLFALIISSSRQSLLSVSHWWDYLRTWRGEGWVFIILAFQKCVGKDTWNAFLFNVKWNQYEVKRVLVVVRPWGFSMVVRNFVWPVTKSLVGFLC